MNLTNIRTNRPTKKLDAKNTKFIITEYISSYSFKLDTPPGVHNVFHSQLLRLAASDPFPSQIQDDSQPVGMIIDRNREYEVNKIIDEKVIRTRWGSSVKLLIKWTNYARPTWEPALAFEDTAALDE